MGCTFTALVLRGRVAHLLHAGDTRAYRFSGNRLSCLTTDHVRQDGTARSHILTRALGVEAEVRLDYSTQPVTLHDRFLLCSDGVHGFLPEQAIADILRERSAPEDTAGALVAAALESGRHRQRHRARPRCCRAADGGIGRCQRGDAAAADHSGAGCAARRSTDLS